MAWDDRGVGMIRLDDVRWFEMVEMLWSGVRWEIIVATIGQP